MKPFPLAVAIAATVALPHSVQADGTPTDVRGAAPFIFQREMELTWVDNCDDEDNFEVEYSLDGVTDWISFAFPARNTTLFPMRGGGPDSVFFFRVRAISPSGNSDWSNPAQITLPVSHGIVDGTYAHGVVGEPLTGPAPQVLPEAPDSFSVEDLPPGLTFDTPTGVISGTPTAAGVFRPLVKATKDGKVASTFVTFRIRPPASGPGVTAPLGPLEILRSGPSFTVDLADHFDDPDTPSAAVFNTTLGPLDIRLFDQATPASVQNFHHYLDDQGYDNAVFHRSVSSADAAGVDIIQTGWFRPDGADYLTIPTVAPVPNEPGLPNIRGSIALAKRGGAPSSGTSGVYFNVQPNPNLDSPNNNGGFTAFGQLTADSLAVMDDLHSRPTGTYDITLSGFATSIPDWPTTAPPAGATPAADELIQVLTATRQSPVRFTRLVESSHPDLFTTDLDGTVLEIHPGATTLGEGLVQLRVSDLDGNTLDQDLLVRVLTDVADWETRQTFPAGADGLLDDGELDLVPNLLEYAFGGRPDQPDAGATTPAVVDLPGGSFGIRFFHHRHSADLRYEVRKSTDLENWSTIWESGDGFDAPLVVERSEAGDYWALTVSDPTFTAAANPDCYFQVEVTLLP